MSEGHQLNAQARSVQLVSVLESSKIALLANKDGAKVITQGPCHCLVQQSVTVSKSFSPPLRSLHLTICSLRKKNRKYI